jgi:hypothetical protein
MIEKERLKLQKERLAERCRAALRRHEQAQAQLSIRLEREKARAAARQRYQAEEESLLQAGKNYATEQSAQRQLAWEATERAAAAARRAASPLAQLRWKAAEPVSDPATAATSPCGTKAVASPCERSVRVPIDQLLPPRHCRDLVLSLAY